MPYFRFLLFQQGKDISDHLKRNIDKSLMIPSRDFLPQINRMDQCFFIRHSSTNSTLWFAGSHALMLLSYRLTQ